MTFYTSGDYSTEVPFYVATESYVRIVILLACHTWHVYANGLHHCMCVTKVSIIGEEDASQSQISSSAKIVSEWSLLPLDRARPSHEWPTFHSNGRVIVWWEHNTVNYYDKEHFPWKASVGCYWCVESWLPAPVAYGNINNRSQQQPEQQFPRRRAKWRRAYVHKTLSIRIKGY